MFINIETNVGGRRGLLRHNETGGRVYRNYPPARLGIVIMFSRHSPLWYDFMLGVGNAQPGSNIMNKMLCLMAGLLFAVTVAGAEDPVPTGAAPAPLSRFSLGVHLSYWNVPDLDEFDLRGAFGLGLSGQYRLHRNLALDLRFSGFAAGDSYDLFRPEQASYKIYTDVVTVPLEAGLLACLPLGESFTLYGGPGMGYYIFDGEIRIEQGPWETTYDLDLKDKGGYYVLLGVRAQLARNAAVYLEGKYTWVETSPKHEFTCPGGCDQLAHKPIDQDLDFSGLAINCGMLFTF